MNINFHVYVLLSYAYFSLWSICQIDKLSKKERENKHKEGKKYVGNKMVEQIQHFCKENSYSNRSLLRATKKIFIWKNNLEFKI